MIRRSLALAGLVVLAGACHPGLERSPWPAPSKAVPATRAGVRTLNDGYRRTRSTVLVREIAEPTRASLDYAAYHANFMIADPEPEGMTAAGTPSAARPFQELLERETLTGDIARTPLTDDERARPLAFAPLVEYLAARKVAGADKLEDVGSAVRGETWGLPGGPQIVRQTASELFVHRPTPSAAAPELWVKVELQPWFHAFRALPDQDGDGFPELYGRVRADLVDPAVVAAIAGDYSTKVLSPAELKTWANQLSGYWYPSYNTDLVAAEASWPTDATEADVKAQLGGRAFAAPTIVMRGKPQGKATYDVFIVGGAAVGASPAPTRGAFAALPKTRPSPRPEPVVRHVREELAAAGGSWEAWANAIAPFDQMVRRVLRATPATVKAIAGIDGYLFFRNSLEYVVGGDLEKQRKGRNPLPIIVQFKKELEARGVDFLFVPVPTKAEILPDEIDGSGKAFVGKVVDPYERKLLLALGEAGVETIDLLPAFLEARRHGDDRGEPLFQHQDTHWTDRGLRLAAQLIGARVKQYPWYAGLATRGGKLHETETTFSRHGDLHSRLPDAEKHKYTPETLVAHQVVRADGSLYDDDPDSPVVVLGDSFTGVYELMDAEHAGVSAHLALDVGVPVDLVMSYGGGPNVRQKLMRRGADALGSKKLVVWIMTARDLYNYWEEWEPLKVK
jgi:alginate O-acetyltransferase complex protein AlgJ